MLIVRVGAMGDVLHALPAVAALRKLRPELEIDWVVDPRWAPLLAEESGQGPVVSGLHLAETRTWSRAPFSGETRRSILALRRALREAHYDAVIDMQGTLRSAVLGRFAQASQFAGYRDPREAPAAWLYKQRLQRQGLHVVEQGAWLLGEALGEGLGEMYRNALITAPSLPLPLLPEAERWAEETLRPLSRERPFVLLAPTAGWGAKQWPAEAFGKLAQRLRQRGYLVLVNAASPGDETAARVRAASLQTTQTVSGGVAGLVALTRRAALVIGGDSGPVHLAAALQTPVLALFGPTDPARNGPWGAGPMRVLRQPGSATSYKRNAATDPGLARLPVDEVLDAALALLQENRTSGSD